MSFGMSQMKPVAEPSYMASSMPHTMNPFAQQFPPQLPSFTDNFMATPLSSGVPRPPGLLHPAQGGSLARPPHAPIQGGLNPTLDFLLNTGDKVQSSDNLAMSNAFGTLVPLPPPAFHEPEDPSESILKLLFEPHDTEASSWASGRPLYENQQPRSSPTAHHGMPRTKNPFAT